MFGIANSLHTLRPHPPVSYWILKEAHSRVRRVHFDFLKTKGEDEGIFGHKLTYPPVPNLLDQTRLNVADFDVNHRKTTVHPGVTVKDETTTT